MTSNIEFTAVEESTLQLLLAKRIAYLAVRTGMTDAQLEAVLISILGGDRSEQAEMAVVAYCTFIHRLERAARKLSLIFTRQIFPAITGVSRTNYREFRMMTFGFVSAMKGETSDVPNSPVL